MKMVISLFYIYSLLLCLLILVVANNITSTHCPIYPVNTGHWFSIVYLELPRHLRMNWMQPQKLCRALGGSNAGTNNVTIK